MSIEKKISIVIPCYGSEKTIQGVVRELQHEMNAHGLFQYEIIMVSDASPDSVYQVICQLAQEDPKIRGIELARNFGQHAALMAGYGIATGDYIVSLDDDGQIPVEQLFSLIERLEDGYDVAYASFQNNTRGVFRLFGTKANDIMENILLEKPRELKTTSFFAMKRFVQQEILRYSGRYPYITGLVLRTTKNICNVPSVLRKRQEGKSGYTLFKLLSLWFNGFTAFSVKPLRVATIIGALCAFAGFVFGLRVVIARLRSPNMPMGYTTIVALLLLIGGIVMLMLGLIGEYVGRIYISINKSPQYVIRDVINCENRRETISEKELRSISSDLYYIWRNE